MQVAYHQDEEGGVGATEIKPEQTVRVDKLSFIAICEREDLNVFVKTLRGATITLWFPNWKAGVEELKARIAEKEGIPPEEQRLEFAGKQLREPYTLEDYNLRTESTVTLLSRMRGC